MATWLDQVNAYRALANLPAVTENPALSDAARKLADTSPLAFAIITSAYPPS